MTAANAIKTLRADIVDALMSRHGQSQGLALCLVGRVTLEVSHCLCYSADEIADIIAAQ